MGPAGAGSPGAAGRGDYSAPVASAGPSHCCRGERCRRGGRGGRGGQGPAAARTAAAPGRASSPGAAAFGGRPATGARFRREQESEAQPAGRRPASPTTARPDTGAAAATEMGAPSPAKGHSAARRRVHARCSGGGHPGGGPQPRTQALSGRCAADLASPSSALDRNSCRRARPPGGGNVPENCTCTLSARAAAPAPAAAASRDSDPRGCPLVGQGGPPPQLWRPLSGRMGALAPSSGPTR